MRAPGRRNPSRGTASPKPRFSTGRGAISLRNVSHRRIDELPTNTIGRSGGGWSRSLAAKAAISSAKNFGFALTLIYHSSQSRLPNPPSNNSPTTTRAQNRKRRFMLQAYGVMGADTDGMMARRQERRTARAGFRAVQSRVKYRFKSPHPDHLFLHLSARPQAAWRIPPRVNRLLPARA